MDISLIQTLELLGGFAILLTLVVNLLKMNSDRKDKQSELDLEQTTKLSIIEQKVTALEKRVYGMEVGMGNQRSETLTEIKGLRLEFNELRTTIVNKLLK